jgi:hypothetical protein
MPTEVVLETLKELGEDIPIRKPLDNVLKMSQLIGAGSLSAQIQ